MARGATQLHAAFHTTSVWVVSVCSLLLPLPALAQCDEPVGSLFSIRGIVTLASRVATLGVNEVCAGELIEVADESRAGLRLTATQTVIRLNRGTRLRVESPESSQDGTWTLQLLDGVMHLFSREPESMRIDTPRVSAAIKGTEFVVDARPGRQAVTVVEGTVSTSRGDLTRVPAADLGVDRVDTFPTDAVGWALFFPPIGVTGKWEEVPRLLSRGMVAEARALIDGAQDAGALSLKSIISQASGDELRAAESARLAVTASTTPTARGSAMLALSYAQQSLFDLDAALESARSAVELDPENGYAWVRLAEMLSTLGYSRDALDTARTAVAKSEDVKRGDTLRAHTILGFVHLTRLETHEALEAFDEVERRRRAAGTDAEADPWVPLGRGLALIRRDQLTAGREKIEEAVSLDPNNALTRSYLGKAYYEERRDGLAGDSFDLAKTTDRDDPTPWLYHAILKQTRNRPTEALSDLNESQRLNDNRLSFRSRLQLDNDLAARSTSLARIYRDLGFDRLGLLEGWRALDSDPGSFSARRFLADSYSRSARHEIARQSELLQSQLRQPLVVNPVQPLIGEVGTFIQQGTGPRDAAFNEYSPLFVRERPVVQLNALVGDDATWGDEVLLSSIHGPASFSVGQFHYESDGARENADQEQDSAVAFGQWAITPATNLQIEARTTEIERGDLVMRIDPDNFAPDQREKFDEDIIRIGLRREFSPRSDLIASYWNQESRTDLSFGENSRVGAELEGDQFEAQYLHRFGKGNLRTGVSYFSGDRIDTDMTTGELFTSREEETDYGAYAYSTIDISNRLSVTLGLSAQSTEGGLVDTDQVNPKVGMAYRFGRDGSTTLRAAAFRTRQRTIASDQTLEPTTIAGFNQFFDDAEGADAVRYGIGIDRAFGETWFAGAEVSRRDIEVTGQVLGPMGPLVSTGDLDERLAQAYIYWVPTSQGRSWSWSFSAELSREEFDRPDGFTGPEEILHLTTDQLEIGANLFHGSGLSARAAAALVDQDGTFGVGPPFGEYTDDGDRFWTMNLDVSYRLPGRRGIVTLGARNVLNTGFRYQDTDLENPRFSAGRFVFARVSLVF